MRKLMLLGGSAQQVIAIETAKRMGLYTILCDYLPDNPGQKYADKFFLISTTDRKAVMKVAQEEGIDGIIAYASDPAAPTAAYISEQLNIPGNPLKAVETLCNKDLFRSFLNENGFNVPKSKSFSIQEVYNTDGLVFPLIIKPVDSSGSKGVTVVRRKEEISKAVEYAYSYSQKKRIVIEEFVEKAHKYLIGGDIFVENGKVIIWGLLNCHRDKGVNPLVPVGKSYPLLISPDDEQLVHATLQKLVSCLGFRNGPMNVELVIDQRKKCWMIDIGPRSGGNMIPDLLGMIFNKNLVEMAIRVAMGLKASEGLYYASHNLHCNKDGYFKDVWFSPEIEKYIIRKNIYKKQGDEIHFFDNAAKAVGIVFFRFPGKEVMEDILEHINEHVSVITE